MTGIGEEFACASCGGTFTKEVDDEEAYAEMEVTWEPVPGDDLAIVCDDCHQYYLSRARAEAPELLTDAEYIASLPQRMADVEMAINIPLRRILPEGVRIEWKDFGNEEQGTLDTSFAEYLHLAGNWPYQLRRPRRDPFHRVKLPAACYRSEYGFMVHVKDACRCR